MKFANYKYLIFLLILTFGGSSFSNEKESKKMRVPAQMSAEEKIAHLDSTNLNLKELTLAKDHALENGIGVACLNSTISSDFIASFLKVYEIQGIILSNTFSIGSKGCLIFRKK